MVNDNRIHWRPDQGLLSYDPPLYQKILIKLLVAMVPLVTSLLVLVFVSESFKDWEASYLLLVAPLAWLIYFTFKFSTAIFKSGPIEVNLKDRKVRCFGKVFTQEELDCVFFRINAPNERFRKESLSVANPEDLSANLGFLLKRSLWPFYKRLVVFNMPLADAKDTAAYLGQIFNLPVEEIPFSRQEKIYAVIVKDQSLLVRKPPNPEAIYHLPGGSRNLEIPRDDDIAKLLSENGLTDLPPLGKFVEFNYDYERAGFRHHDICWVRQIRLDSKQQIPLPEGYCWVEMSEFISSRKRLEPLPVIDCLPHVLKDTTS